MNPIKFVGGMAVLAVATAAFGQSSQPTIFVANNGNLQGSVTSFHVNADGTLTFVDQLITGERPPGAPAIPGTNCYSIAISPNGRYLAIGHASGVNPQWMTVLEVHSDATLSLVNNYFVPNTPLDLLWIDDEHIAVVQSDSSALPSRVRVWRFNAESDSLIQTAIENVGAFGTSLAIDPAGQYLYTQATSGSASPNQVSAWNILPGGQLSHSHTLVVSSFPMGLGVSPNGQWLFAAGGISSGGNVVQGFEIDHEDGFIWPMWGTPFFSPGSSPKQVTVSSDNAFAIVGHGTDATVRTFSIDPDFGDLTYTGNWVKVGGQGDLGLISVLDNFVFTTRRYSSSTWGPTGVVSYTLGADGSLTQNGSTFDTQGIHPHDVAVWPGLPSHCPADLTGSGGVGVPDLLLLLAAWGPNPGHAADLTGDGNVGVPDLLFLLADWGPCK